MIEAFCDYCQADTWVDRDKSLPPPRPSPPVDVIIWTKHRLQIQGRPVGVFRSRLCEECRKSELELSRVCFDICKF